MNMTPQDLSSVDPEILEIIQQLRLMDDYFMQVCLQNSVECTELILRIILDKPDLKVQRVTAQKALANLYGHDARLDVFALDSENQPYDIEIQRESRGAQPRRARYYSSLLDANQKDVGSNYEGLPESFVIFITERDVLKGNLPLYNINRRIEETGGAFGDGAHIIYVNGEQRHGDTALSRLMHDFFCTRPEEMYYEALARLTGFHKTDSKEVLKMSGAIERYAEKRMERGVALATEKGIAIGTEKGIAIGTERAGHSIALNLLADGFSCEKVAKYANLPIEVVRSLAEQRKK